MNRSPTPEQLRLRRQGMRGYALVQGGQALTRTFRLLDLAEKRAERLGAQVVLVRNDGTLYVQDGGKAIAPLEHPRRLPQR